MSINNPQASAAVNVPRLQILNNGSPIPGALEFTVNNNNYYQADTFSAQFALRADPAYNASWWGLQQTLLLDLQGSIDDGNSWTSLILGQTDRIVLDPVAGVVKVTGRDLTSQFIDTKTRNTYQNQTSSQVVQALVAQLPSQGLTPMTADVTPTTTLIGRYYAADHVRVTNNQFGYAVSEWDLMCGLAEKEGFDIWVTGTTLHFHPSVDPSGADPYSIVWSENPRWSNVETLSMERSLVLATDVVVAVQSWSSENAKGFTVYDPNFLASGRVAQGKAQLFTIVRPNLTQQQALALAQQARLDISRHERLLTLTCPGISS